MRRERRPGLPGGAGNRRQPRPGRTRQPLPTLLLLLSFLSSTPLRAEFQFDVFLGLNQGFVDASWAPVVCEVFNDGPAFNATVTVSPSQFDSTRSITLELPTGTRKRFVIPVFAPVRYNGTWNVRLLDEKRRVVAEHLDLQGKPVSWHLPLMGSLTGRNPPAFPETVDRKNKLRPELEPWVARLQTDTFPDHPIALQGLHSLHLSSGQSLESELNPEQVKAILAWIHSGGHLILSVEQTTHVNGTDWLRQLLPCRLTEKTNVTSHSGLQAWVASTRRVDGTHHAFNNPGRGAENPFADLKPDLAFEQEPLEVAIALLRDGLVLAGSTDQPLVITAPRGRGRVTVLTFDPDRQPFRSWANRAHFWAKLADIPPDLLLDKKFDHYTAYSIDGVIGAMIDSKQIRKLPVAWLLLLLLGYLAVIGPIDRYWLKKINRQMLTWITFPCYVVVFSGLIYLIGYKLRAGEREWNELQIVDVLPLPAGGSADLRGRTYASIYSPANARFDLTSEEAVATLRGEMIGSGFGEGSSAQVSQRGNSFDARVSVPVWTSQLFVSDWLRRQRSPAGCSIVPAGSGYQVRLTNQIDRTFAMVRMVIGNQIYELNPLAPGQADAIRLPITGDDLQSFIGGQRDQFQRAHDSRRQAFGQDTGNLIPDLPVSSMALSFLQLGGNVNPGFITPPGFDLSPLLDRDQAVLLVWVEDYGAAAKMNRLSFSRQNRHTLFRLAIPIQAN